ncbi:MAG TPA: hypothetical protein VI915_00895 [Thermoplasmata archaeon]|nr:hypothetical protein [Thermoplasmata archaeon]
MTLEGYHGPDYVLLSYDVSSARRSAAVEVCRIIFGRRRSARRDGSRAREEAGFIHRPGVVWVGQSVLFLPPRDALELEPRLRILGARVSSVHVPVSLARLQVFRRPR